MASPKLHDSTILMTVIYLNLMVLSWTCKCCAVGLFAVQYWYIFPHGSFEVLNKHSNCCVCVSSQILMISLTEGK